MRQLLFSVGFLFLFGGVCGNNIKVNGEARVVGFIGAGRDTAIVEFGISWENSWRDDFNWDAAWIFLKYKKRGLTSEWHHAYLSGEGHEVQPQGGDTGSYMFMFGEVGEGSAAEVTGVFLMRDGLSEGNVNTRVRVKWPLQGNSRLPLTEEDFGENRDSIFIAAYAVEMVYVPYGAYTLGDDFSNGTFVKNGAGPIPAAYDIVDNRSGYTITGYPAHYSYSGPANVADHVNSPNWDYSYGWHVSGHNGMTWWKIDFNTPREVKYFGVTPPNNICTSDRIPIGSWRLEGSDDDTNWDVLWEGDPSDWTSKCGLPVGYPVQQSIRVTHPGKYRYYRLNFDYFQSMVMMNLAMTEKELYPYGYYFVVEGEEELFLTDLQARDGQSWSGSLPASYPKGYRGYYCMKYEVSQEQYVEFLNSLTLAQQKNRVANNDFDHMVKGDYAFGDLKRPNCRNGIAFIMTKGAGTPAVFGNNLNPGNKFYSEDDGQTLACNYLSPADMLAYCDWSGLRPMSEMEYEKACRRPYPQLPDRGELAWNTAGGIHKIRTENDLTGAYTERETPFDYRVNVNSGGRMNGPLRSGAFATSRTGQVEAGATYWGLMEMSGNVWEMCYSANAAGRSFVGDNAGSSHGDGYLNSDGTTDIGASYWPNVVGALAVRGGSFAGADSLLRTSDRTYATGNYFSVLTQRDSTVGFRGVRSVLNSSGFTGGEIYCVNNREADSVCNGVSFSVIGNPAGQTIGKTVYSWYISEDNGVSWAPVEGATTLSLNSEGWMNPGEGVKVLQFRRKAVCSVGEEYSNTVSVSIMPEVKRPELKSRELLAGFGHRLVLPDPLDGTVNSGWMFPSGAIHEGKNVVIQNYTAGDDGIYKLWHEAGGCRSEMIEVKIEGISGVPLIDYGLYRAWADGSFSKSAKTYLNPAAPYVYQGATGSGVYRIDVDGSGAEGPVNTYCDMEFRGGGWTLLFHHHIAGGYWPGKNVNTYHPDEPENDLYSILYLTDYFKAADGKFLFWLNYPSLANQDNVWKQTDNPCSITNLNQNPSAPGYEAVDVKGAGWYWGGLARNDAGYCYLDGSWYSNNWWNGIATNAVYSANGRSGITGPYNICVPEVKLWVRE